MRTLTFFSALSETTEICGAISTGDGWGKNGRKRRVNRGGRSSGGGANTHPGTNGERGDLSYTGGRVEWEGERMILEDI